MRSFARGLWANRSEQRVGVSGSGIALGAVGVLTAVAWVILCAGPAGLGRAQGVEDAEALKHTSVGLPIERVGRFADNFDGTGLKFGRAAMLDPIRAAELRESFKTPERKAAEAKARWAILDPEAYRQALEAEWAQRPQTPAEKAATERENEKRQRALQAILNPVAAGREEEKNLDAESKRRRAIAQEAILKPHEFNARVDRHKSAALREREAEVIQTFTDPKRFIEQRERLHKTGSKARSKGETPPPDDRSKGPEKPKGKEKGQ